jgi:hypothetical protein
MAMEPQVHWGVLPQRIRPWFRAIALEGGASRVCRSALLWSFVC